MSNFRSIIFWAALLCGALLLFAVFQSTRGKKDTTYTVNQFVNKIQDGSVKEVKITGSDVEGTDNQGKFKTKIPPNYPDIYKMLQDKNVNTTYDDASSSTWVSILVQASPFVVVMFSGSS